MAASRSGAVDPLGWGAIFMLESIPVAVVAGLVLGYLAGLGIGGGSLLMLWLTIALQMDYAQARAINLMFFLAAAGAVSFFRWKQGVLDIRQILPAVIAGCVCAGLTTWFSDMIDKELIQKLFGVLLLLTGLRELFYRPRKAR